MLMRKIAHIGWILKSQQLTAGRRPYLKVPRDAFTLEKLSLSNERKQGKHLGLVKGGKPPTVH